MGVQKMTVGFNAYIDTKEDVVSFIKSLMNRLEELEQENEELREENDCLKNLLNKKKAC